MAINLHSRRQRGYTLVELIVYIAIAAVVLLAIVSAVEYAYVFYRQLTVGPRVDQAGAAAAERIIRDIRTGSSVDLTESTFGVPLGELTITAGDGATTSKKFYVDSGELEYQEGSADPVALSPADMYVSRFLLNYLSTGESQAVRFELELTYPTDAGTSTRSYTGLAILRHSYE